MNEYRGNEFFDNLSRQDLLELGYTAQHEPEDYYVALLQRGEDLKRLQQQLKKQGDDPHDPLKTNPSEAVNGAVGVGAFTRKHTLLPEGVTVTKPKKKGNADRLMKAMGINKSN